MSEQFHQLLDATIQHLEDLQAHVDRKWAELLRKEECFGAQKS